MYKKQNIFQVLQIFTFICIFIFVSKSYSKCIGFDLGTPNFCAKITLTKKVKNFEEKCFFYGAIVEMKSTSPKKNEFEQFREVLKKRKRNNIFEASGSICGKDFQKQEIHGVLVARCNDNLLIGRGFLEALGIEPPLADFYISKNPSVQIFENGDFVNVSVHCDAIDAEAGGYQSNESK